MPIYNFQITKGGKVIDPNSVDLPDANAAKHYAQRLARGLTALSHGLGGLRHLTHWDVQVSDETGKPIARYEVEGVPRSARNSSSSVQS